MGACLEVATDKIAAIPDGFKLIIKPEVITRHCAVAWRTERHLGVRFV